MERALPYNVNVEDVLAELLEYMEDREDVKDSDTGPSPNEEMRFAQDIRQALFQLQKPIADNTKCNHNYITTDCFNVCTKCNKNTNRFANYSPVTNGQSMNFDNDPPVI